MALAEAFLVSRSGARVVALLALAALLAAPIGLGIPALVASSPDDARSTVTGFGPAPPPSTGSGAAANGPAPALFPGEARVTHDGHWQNEPNLAVNPKDAKNLITGSNDYRWHGINGGFVWTGAYTSHDGGQTWTEQALPGANAGSPTPGFLPFASAGDFIGAFNGLGLAFAGGIDFAQESLVFVSASADGGDTWLQGTFPGASLAAYPAQFQDKPDMAGDPNSPLVYVCWTQFGPGLDTIMVSASPTGATWTPALPVSPTELSSLQGCSLAVGSDGTVYMAYDRFSGCLSCGGQLKVTSSPVGGAAWGTPVLAATATPVSGASFRVTNFPLLAVDNSNGGHAGNLYLVWADNRAGEADIWMVHSSDKGATWSAPVRVNQNTVKANHYMPSVAVGNDGTVYAGFYDTRNGGYQYYGARSTDGGQTFTDFPLASATSSAGSTGGFFGDYTDMQVGPDGVVHAVWTDGRSGDQDIWTRAFN